MAQTLNQSSAQIIFREMVLGTLVYSVVLGFFNDYTDILDTKSYSITFLAALALQILTYLTILLKNWVVSKFRTKPGNYTKVLMGFSIWLIMFFSKFVFLGVIDFIFGSYVEISGFVGLLAIIITMTIAKQAIDIIYSKLGK